MTNHPNIIYILADDMGYGDVRHLNPNCQFSTPHIDQLGQEGMFFSDAHSSSSVCTPSRYSIMTGRYCWRTFMKKGVLGGTGGPLIERNRLTIAQLLKNAGYQTACIGKWHLGWNWATKPNFSNKPDRSNWDGNEQEWIDFNQPITQGPTSYGFDAFYGISGSLDMPPYVYVENDLPVEEPTAWATNKEFIREGLRIKSLRANNVLSHLTDKAVNFIESQGNQNPFFLYFPLTAPHGPIAPAPEFAGKSKINPYADFCMEVDHRVGQILKTLDKKGIAENTLVIFTTDNGAAHEPSEAYTLSKHYDHHSGFIYRGFKSDIWDGGHRLPFLVRWPRKIKPNTSNHQRIAIFDLFATAAEITGQQMADNEGEDSVSLLPAFQGNKIDESKRTCLIHHSVDGMFAIRKGKWKLCRCPGSGGWSLQDGEARRQGLPEIQLYDMEKDPSERNNQCHDYPHLVQELTETLHQAVMRGRTTPGINQPDAFEGKFDDWPDVNWLPEIPEKFVIDD